MFIKPLSRRKTAFAVEFKVASDIEELERRADEAIAQIEEKAYALELVNDGYKSIACYGIAFYRKDCKVKIELFHEENKDCVQ